MVSFHGIVIGCRQPVSDVRIKRPVGGFAAGTAAYPTGADGPLSTSSGHRSDLCDVRAFWCWRAYGNLFPDARSNCTSFSVETRNSYFSIVNSGSNAWSCCSEVATIVCVRQTPYLTAGM